MHQLSTDNAPAVRIDYAGAPPMRAAAAEPVVPLYVVEGLASIAANLLSVGIFFYTASRFGWSAQQNLTLAAAQGVVYVVAAMLAGRVNHAIGHRAALYVAYVGMTILSAAAGVLAQAGSEWGVVGMLLAFSVLNAINWPALESLVCTGVSSHGMARRLAVYNLVWPGVSAATIAVSGTVIQHWPAGLFGISAASNLGAAAVLWFSRRGAAGEPGGAAGECAAPGAGAAEPELLAARSLALGLSRIALPSTFVVIYALMAMMPSLPLIQRLAPEQQTVVGSAWMAARWLGFVVCGWTVFWHTRPRLMLWSAVAMLLAFLGITLPWPIPSPIPLGTGGWIAWMIGWQVVLGLAMAIIYSASLYFGMVLSDASAEHSGYHEALIGLGSVVGPGAGALAQTLGGANGLFWAIGAVAGVIGLSVLVAGAVAVRQRPRAAAPPAFN